MSQSWWYLLTLVGSLAGMVLLDRRHSLVFFKHFQASTLAIALGVAFFAIADLVGIFLGVFFRGDSPYLSGLVIAPEFPVEELLFLTLLCYCILAVYSAVESQRTSS
jgi:lycopene cyclase domain-containing protein